MRSWPRSCSTTSAQTPTATASPPANSAGTPGITIDGTANQSTRSEGAQRVALPEGFMWGVATAAHQVEGNNTLNDWWQAESTGRLPVSGVACDHWHRFRADFDLARSWHHSAHRFSVEWSRIEPEPGSWDEEALQHYVDVVDALIERRLEPVLTLHHFTNPVWFVNRGGWLARDAPELFARFATRVVEALGDKVRWWLTVNEPTVWSKHAFVTGDWPPFQRGRWFEAGRAIRAMARAHRLAYEAIHSGRSDARVGFAHSVPFVEPCRSGRLLDRAAARARDFLLNQALLRMIGTSRDAPLDFIGLNYYARTIVRHGWTGAGALWGVECMENHHHGPRRWSDMGWEIYPEGLLQVLRNFSTYGFPLLVTENGLATDDEALRVEVLADHLNAIATAAEEGIDVRGYFCWTLVDNYEWAQGMRPHFGLASLDPVTLDRLPRPAAAFMADVCARNSVPRPKSGER